MTIVWIVNDNTAAVKDFWTRSDEKEKSLNTDSEKDNDLVRQQNDFYAIEHGNGYFWSAVSFSLFAHYTFDLISVSHHWETKQLHECLLSLVVA